MATNCAVIVAVPYFAPSVMAPVVASTLAISASLLLYSIVPVAPSVVQVAPQPSKVSPSLTLKVLLSTPTPKVVVVGVLEEASVMTILSKHNCPAFDDAPLLQTALLPIVNVTEVEPLEFSQITSLTPCVSSAGFLLTIPLSTVGCEHCFFPCSDKTKTIFTIFPYLVETVNLFFA